MATARLIAAVVLVLLAPAAAANRAATREYTPPPQPGDIYTVIDFPFAHGAAEGISVMEEMGSRRRDLVAAPRYSCEHSTPSGVVVRFRHFTADALPLTLTTTGTILRGPYQGGLPPEALHHCYQLVS
jgi:hypothetical protein